MKKTPDLPEGKPSAPNKRDSTTSDRRKIGAKLMKRQSGTIDAALAGLIAFGTVCAVMLVGVI